MKDEIKEYIKEQIDKYYVIEHKDFEKVDLSKLLDYITNLQRENRLLKINKLEKQFPNLNAVEVEIDTYKSKIEKAIEYIEKYDKEPIKSWNKPKENLLNILRGDE